MLLEGKQAFITGGTRGIGKAIAEEFVRQGASVWIVGTSEEKTRQALEGLKVLAVAPDQKFQSSGLNVADHTRVREVVEELYKAWGELDIVVNCAGVTRDNFLMKMTEKDWDDVLDINLKSAYNVCHAVIKPMLKARKGKIINISSVIGLTGNAGQVNYSASKFGLVGFTRSLAIEVAKRGICVNCIAPGFISTDMTGVLTEEQKEGILSKVPMQRLGKPEEIAYAAVFLASSMSDYMTGQVMTIDGGMLA
ncbi:MAG: 3-oxoacyl-[acyl-carrier-protein] reductase [Chlamydiae bacterium]|nr:3-oxoacyl-[acyl-carrier-protein] reductase [Chlamydiota bacterium]